MRLVLALFDTSVATQQRPASHTKHILTTLRFTCSNAPDKTLLHNRAGLPSAHNCTISTKSIQPMAHTHTFCTSTHTAHKWPSHTPRTTTIHLAAPAAPRRAGIASNGHIIGLAPLTMHICQARPTAHGHTARPTRAARYGRTPHDPTPPAWRTYTAKLSNLSNLSKLSNLSNLSSAVAPPPE